MTSTRGKVTAGVIIAPLLLGGAQLLRAAGHGGAAFLLESTHSVSTLRTNLDDIARGSYAKSQAVDLFCAASSSLATTGQLPDEATDWRAFVKARVGYDSDPEEYFDGKADQLETAVGLAQRNPRVATKYAQACLLP